LIEETDSIFGGTEFLRIFDRGKMCKRNSDPEQHKRCRDREIRHAHRARDADLVSKLLLCRFGGQSCSIQDHFVLENKCSCNQWSDHASDRIEGLG